MCLSNSPSIFLRRPSVHAICERCMLAKRYRHKRKTLIFPVGLAPYAYKRRSFSVLIIFVIPTFVYVFILFDPTLRVQSLITLVGVDGSVTRMSLFYYRHHIFTFRNLANTARGKISSAWAFKTDTWFSGDFGFISLLKQHFFLLILFTLKLNFVMCQYLQLPAGQWRG